jgi:cardiolipin synthase
VIMIICLPLVGTLLYFWIGINRVKRRALDLRGWQVRRPKGEGDPIPAGAHAALAISGRVNLDPLRKGNKIELLVNGEQAFPAMLGAIRDAKESISLETYIFDNDPAGREFAQALCEASERGVEVRILVDAVGARYSFPSIFRQLHGAHLKATRFMETLFPWRYHYSQLRNHRKLLVVDGQVGFLGGMNLRQGHLVTKAPAAAAIQDLHFRCLGPVVADLQHVFAADWEFASLERLEGPLWFPALAHHKGSSVARVLTDGPDADIGKLRWTLLGAISVARKSVRILTPYFVPDQALLDSLGIAALRGVRVEIVLPERNNVVLVQWASQALLWQLLERGIRVFATHAPFDHSKLFLVDDSWAMIGSANWDARSLRLNFELGLEIEDTSLVNELDATFARKRDAGREVTLEDVDSRPVWMRLRDGTARLFTPYL